jgi:hypothetical protein
MAAPDYPHGNTAGYYWNAYFEWRATYTLKDDCMLELARAIRAEIDSGSVSGEDSVRLKKLARMIETEVAAVAAEDRAA